MLKIIRSQISPLIVHNIRFISSSKIMEHGKKTNSEVPYNYSYSLFQTRYFANSSPTNITNINAEQLKEFIIQNEALIIDVRTKEELAATGILPNSLNIPLDELSTAFELTPEEFLKKYNIAKPNKDLHIVFSCAKGIRSLKASHYVADLGYKNIFNFTEGWFGWESQKK